MTNEEKLKHARYALDMAYEHTRDCDSHHASRALDYLHDAVTALVDMVESMSKSGSEGQKRP